jgi:hypothetical protein
MVQLPDASLARGYASVRPNPVAAHFTRHRTFVHPSQRLASVAREAPRWQNVSPVPLQRLTMKRVVIPALFVLLVSPMAMADSVCGKYRGVVTNAVDPELRGRVLVQVPSLAGDEQWALPNAAFGKVELPAVGDAVWVSFEECDVASPIWEGSPVVQCKLDRNGQVRNCQTP